MKQFEFYCFPRFPDGKDSVLVKVQKKAAKPDGELVDIFQVFSNPITGDFDSVMPSAFFSVSKEKAPELAFGCLYCARNVENEANSAYSFFDGCIENDPTDPVVIEVTTVRKENDKALLIFRNKIMNPETGKRAETISMSFPLESAPEVALAILRVWSDSDQPSDNS